MAILQQLIFEAFIDALYFPLWWYSKGAKRIGQRIVELFLAGNRRLAPLVWIKNIFVPMYGQFDWQGRIISFVMRTVQIVVRSGMLFLWAGCCVLLFLLWIIFPMLVTYQLVIGLRHVW